MWPCADTFDAMTTDRPYRKALPDEVAFEEIRKYAGVHYPKEVVKAFFAAVEALGEGGSSRLKSPVGVVETLEFSITKSVA